MLTITRQAVMVALTLTAMVCSPSVFPDPGSSPKISVQLWSLKEMVATDIDGALKAISEMDFDGVEFAGEFGKYAKDPEGLRQRLNTLDLEVSGAHVTFSQFENDNFQESLHFYQTIGAELLVIPLDPRAWSDRQVDTFIRDLIDLNKKLKKHGINVGYHNHHFEFGKYKNETYWDHIAKSSPEDIVLQLDIGWVAYAGYSPEEYIAKYPGRSKALHFKSKVPKQNPQPSDLKVDGNKSLQQLFTQVMKESEAIYKSSEYTPIIGRDGLDWEAYIEAATSIGGTEWFVLEQEEYPNGLTPLESVSKSKKELERIMGVR